MASRHVPASTAQDRSASAGATITGRDKKQYPVYQRTVESAVLPSAMRVHPKGFKLLSKGSPLERSMSSYFQLPQQPSRKAQQELKTVKRTLRHSVHAPAVVLLDGFLMLEATQVQDPTDATEVVLNDANVGGSVAEDLAYFEHIAFADFGENALNVAALAPFPALEEAHLHCNAMTHTGLPLPAPDADRPPLGLLHTLNLSFNRLLVDEVAALASLPALRRLDLSHNGLTLLPDMSGLVAIEQLALEGNRLEGAAPYRALAAMPMLRELNLNFNALTTLPQQQPRDPAPESGGDPSPAVERWFDALEILSVAANQVMYLEDLYNAAALSKLARVVLWGNPIEQRRKDRDVLCYELEARGIEVVMDSPVPPKRKTGQFYVEAVSTGGEGIVRVPRVDGRGMPVAKKKKKAPQPGSASSALVSAENAPNSFFVTQVNEEPVPPPGSSPEHVAPEVVAHGDPEAGYSLFHTAEATALSTGAVRSPATGSNRGKRPSVPQAQDFGLSLGEEDAVGSVLRPNGNMRTMVNELRRMLRQPLPPVPGAMSRPGV